MTCDRKEILVGQQIADVDELRKMIGSIKHLKGYEYVKQKSYFVGQIMRNIAHNMINLGSIYKNYLKWSFSYFF